MAKDQRVGTRLNDGEGLEIAHEEDFGIRRSEDGELLPVTQRIPGTDKAVRVRPPPSIEEHEDVFERAEAPDDRVADVLSRFVVEGIGADATAEWVERTPDYLVSGVLQAIKNAAGHEVFLAVQRERNEEMRTMLELVDTVGVDRLEQLSSFAENESSSSTSSSRTGTTGRGISPGSTPASSDGS